MNTAPVLDQPPGDGGSVSRGWLRAAMELVRLSPGAPSGSLYHGFISYSHAADGKLAPAVQTGLQRFAKPWYRVRALHIFRDDASLSANPQLWGSIKQSLEASQYLILLASPQAAASEWVSKEAEYWCEHKQTAKILIGLTDGELVWDGSTQRVDWKRTDALPAVLERAFSEEPRFVDLRWAQNADDLALTHPRWREAIAELAAPLHGKPKDELASEEVRQHRRTIRIVRTAAAALISLTVAAAVLGLVAYSQYRTAQARALAAEATSALATNPEQGLALAVRSTEIDTSATGIQALRSALAQAPARIAIDSGAGATAQAAWSPAGDQIAVSGPREQVQLWNPRSGRVEHILAGAGGNSPIVDLVYSPNGEWLAAVTQAGAVMAWNVSAAIPISTAVLNRQIVSAYSVGGSTQQGGVSLLGTTVSWSVAEPDTLLVHGFGIRRLLSFNARTGTTAQAVVLPHGVTGVDAAVPSPDGTRLFLAFDTPVAQQRVTGVIVNIAAQRSLGLAPNVDMSQHDACWFADSRGFVTWDPNEAQDLALRWWNAASGRQVGVFPTPLTITATACSQSASQDWVATGDRTGTVLLRLVNGTTFQLSGHRRFITALASSRNGDYVATASDDGTARVWDTRTGAPLRILDDGDEVTGVQFSPDGGLALTTDQQGIVRVWDTGVGEPVTSLALPGAGDTFPLGFADGGRLLYGLTTSFHVHGYLGFRQPFPLSSASILLWSDATGAIVRRIPLPSDIEAASVAAGVPCSKQGLSLEGCVLSPPSGLVVPLPVPGQFTWELLGVAVNNDASEIAYSDAGGVGVINRDGGLVEQLPLPQRPTGLSFSGRQLVVMTDRAVFVGRPSPRARMVRLPQPSPPMDAEVSADGTRLVTGDLNGTVTVWNSTTPAPVAIFHVTRAFSGAVSQLSGRLESSPGLGGPPVPLRVAINADGSTIAAGTAWQTVFIWSVDNRRQIAARLVSSPVDTGVGAPGAPTQGGFNGPWAIADLGFSADGSRLVAVDFPYYSATDSRAPATAEVFSSTGSSVGIYQSADVAQGAIDPGASLSPNGGALLAGVLDLAPDASTANNAVYQASTGDELLNLQTGAIPANAIYYDWPSPAQPWSTSGIEVLAGTRIYACDACGSVAEMEQAARTRLAWLKPLSAARDVTPSGNPYR